nr:carbohydrate ABC transporter permease [uncultured Cohaesibacter sp.]
MNIPVSSISDSSKPNWEDLARRSRRSRTIFLGTLLVFLGLISLPVIIPYLWLFTISLTRYGEGTMLPVFWRMTILVVSSYILFIVLPPFLPQNWRRWVPAGIAACSIVWVGLFVWPLITTDNFLFFINPSKVMETQMGLDRVDGLPSIWAAMGNSMALALSQTALVLFVATPAAYALSRLPIKGRRFLSRSVLLLRAFPAMALTVAIFFQLYWIGLLNSLVGVVLVLAALELPFAILILKSFFDTVPWDIEMSAVSDGATRFQAFRMVVLPQVTGGLIAVGIFTFLRGWEEYVFVKTLLIGNTKMTMSLYVFWISDEAMGANSNLIAATGVMYVAPVIVLYLFAQKYLTQINLGGIKG